MKHLIEEWKENAEQKQDGTFDFLNWLKHYKSLNQVDQVAKESHEEVFSEIDCTKCANCCKTISPQVDTADIKRISAFLAISKDEFIERYLKLDDEDQYEMNALPCPFLTDDKCSIYEVRPKVCRGFPYTDKKEFTTRRYLHTANTKACPGVYHIIKTMKDKFNWRQRR